MTALATRIYFTSPIWLQNLMITAYGVRLRRLRYGRVQRDSLASLRLSQWLPGEELQAIQLGELNRVVSLARKTVPLYHGWRLPDASLGSLDEIRHLPLLTKEQLQQPAAVVTSNRFKGERLQQVHTGGTTGTPLTIYCDRSTLQRNYAFFGRFLEWAGVRAGAKVATFAGRTVVPPKQDAPPFWRRNAASNTLLFSSYHISPSTVAVYLDRLEAFAPDLIDSYPSSIEPIARHALSRGGSSLRPAAVIASSETLSPSVRELIERAFHTRVFDHYGAAEMAALVTQCEAGSYHANPEFGIVEVLRDGQPVAPGETGDLVATGFINPVMPLIRYVTGDTAVQGAEPCRCGRAFPTLLGIEGRRDDVLITPEGRRIGRLDPVFKAVSSIHETRIVQDAHDHVRVEMVLHANLAPEEEAALRRELSYRLGPSMKMDLVRVGRLPRTARGKLRAVVNEVGITAPSILD